MSCQHLEECVARRAIGTLCIALALVVVFASAVKAQTPAPLPPATPQAKPAPQPTERLPMPPGPLKAKRNGPDFGHVDLEVVYAKFWNPEIVDPGTLVSKKLGTQLAKFEATDKEGYDRYVANQSAYTWLGKDPKVIRSQVLREIRTCKLLTKFMDEITPKTDLKKLAAEYGLQYYRYVKADRLGLQVHPQIGSPRIPGMVWGTALPGLSTGAYKMGTAIPYVTRTKGVFWPRIFDNPANFMAVMRLTKFYPPESWEVREGSPPKTAKPIPAVAPTSRPKKDR